MKIRRIIHAIVSLIIVINILISVEQILRPYGEPFSEEALNTKQFLSDYTARFSPLYPYDNALEYPWVDINPSHPYYVFVTYKERFQTYNPLFLSSKRASELFKYGTTMDDDLWIKQLNTYEALIRDQASITESKENLQERLVLYKQLYLNLLQHRYDFRETFKNDPHRINDINTLFSSLLEELPSIFQEEEFVYYFPSTIISDKELGLYEITIFRDSEMWSDLTFNSKDLSTLWNNNQIIIQEIIDEETDTLLIKNPYSRNNQRKFSLPDIHQLPIISARKIESLEGLFPTAEFTRVNDQAVLTLKDYNKLTRDYLLARKAPGWELIRSDTSTARSQIFYFEYVTRNQAIMRLVVTIATLVLYIGYTLYYKIIIKKLKTLKRLRVFFRTKYLNNPLLFVSLVMLSTLLPQVGFVIIAMALTLYAFLNFKEEQLLRRLAILIIAMAVLHSLKLNLFAERLAYFIIYIIIGMVITKLSNLKVK